MFQANRVYESQAGRAVLDWLALANLVEWERIDLVGRTVVS